MIEKDDMERMKEIFITRKEHEQSIGNIESRINKDNVRLAVIESQLKIITWVLYAVAGGIITMLVEMFFGN